MKLISKSTQEAFARSPWLKVGSVAGASLLLIASLFGVWRAFSTPAKIEEPVVVLNYEHGGEFDYLVYLKPNSLYGSKQPQSDGTTSVVFFRKIIDEARLAFSYKFDSSQPLADVTNQVEVSIIAENPGMWQKEIPILEETHEGREFKVDFPLHLKSLESVVDDIEEEIGVGSYQNQFIIKAIVHTTAETAGGRTIEDDFSHEITAIIQTNTLQLQGSLKRSDTGSKDDISYSEEGWFDYEVYLKPNKLYETPVLRSEPPPAAEPPAEPPAPPHRTSARWLSFAASGS